LQFENALPEQTRRFANYYFAAKHNQRAAVQANHCPKA